MAARSVASSLAPIPRSPRTLLAAPDLVAIPVCHQGPARSGRRRGQPGPHCGMCPQATQSSPLFASSGTH